MSPRYHPGSGTAVVRSRGFGTGAVSASFRRRAPSGYAGIVPLVRPMRLAALLPLLALTVCRSQPLVTPRPIVSPNGAALNRLAILRGRTLHHWTVVEERPGAIVLQLSRRNRHLAVVTVSYDDDTIQIRYLNSEGLLCEPEGESCRTIHRAYNRWVVQLAEDIRWGLDAVRMERRQPQSL